MRLTAAGVVVLLASVFVTWSGFAYDGVRLPVVAVGAMLVAVGGAFTARNPLPAPGRAWAVAAGAYLAAHVASLAAAVNVGAAIDALVPVAGGAAIGWALARRAMPALANELAPVGLVLVAILTSLYGIAQRLDGGAAVGVLGNTNYSGAFAAILACACAAVAIFAT